MVEPANEVDVCGILFDHANEHPGVSFRALLDTDFSKAVDGPPPKGMMHVVSAFMLSNGGLLVFHLIEGVQHCATIPPGVPWKVTFLNGLGETVAVTESPRKYPSEEVIGELFGKPVKL